MHSQLINFEFQRQAALNSLAITEIIIPRVAYTLPEFEEVEKERKLKINRTRRKPCLCVLMKGLERFRVYASEQ